MTHAPPPQVWPTLRARDARALITFLVEAFGFEATAVYGDGDRVDHAELAWPPGGGIMLGSARESYAAGHWPLKPGFFGAYVVTDEPDALFARATAAGAEVLAELHDPTTAHVISPSAIRRATTGPSVLTAAPPGLSSRRDRSGSKKRPARRPS